MLGGFVPACKTDPKALDKTTSWDCVCDSVLAKPCAFHAVESHCSQLDRWFAHLQPLDDLPLFPDIEGRPVCKTMVVKFIEWVATKLGLHIVWPAGTNL